MDNRLIRYISLSTLCVGVVCILAAAIITPEFVVKFISNDGILTHYGHLLLSHYRWMSFVVGIMLVLMGFLRLRYQELGLKQLEFNRPMAIFIFFLTLIGIAYTPVLSFIHKGLEAPFRYFASDVYYYLIIARRSTHIPYFTFDGIFPSNGFHPLWQYYLTLFFKFLHTKECEILFTYFSCIILTGIGMSFIAVSILRITDSPTLSIIATLPGAYYILFTLPQAHYGAAWSFINGMESSLSIFLFGIALYLLIVKKLLNRITYARIILASLLLSFLILTRLDNIFLLLPYILFLVIYSWRKGKNFKPVIAGITAPVLLILLYLLWNVHYAGMALPVSGASKAGIAIFRNLYSLLGVFNAKLQFSHNWMWSWKENTWRIMQIVVPVFIAGIFLWQHFIEWIKSHNWDWDTISYFDKVLCCFCLYVIAKGMYNFINVNLMNQGHWYFPLSIIIGNIIIARWIPLKRDRWIFLGLAIVFAIYSANVFADLKRTSQYNALNFKVYQEGQRLANKLSSVYKGRGLIEYDDGIVGYSLGIPTMGGLGFTLDKEASEAKLHNHLLELAYSRGFSAFCSANYFGLNDEAAKDEAKLSELIKSENFIQNELNEKQSKWHFYLLYKDAKTGLAFIGFSPKSE